MPATTKQRKKLVRLMSALSDMTCSIHAADLLIVGATTPLTRTSATPRWQCDTLACSISATNLSPTAAPREHAFKSFHPASPTRLVTDPRQRSISISGSEHSEIFVTLNGSEWHPTPSRVGYTQTSANYSPSLSVVISDSTLHSSCRPGTRTSNGRNAEPDSPPNDSPAGC